jgi:hypothetical protein
MVQVSIVNPFWQAIIFFLVCTVILHIFFVWIFPQELKTWKAVEYVWLGLTCFSILTAVADIRRYTANAALPTFREDAIRDFNRLHNWITDKSIRICGQKFIKNEYSPRDFDEMVKQYANACKWLTAVKNIIPTCAEDEFTKVDISEKTGDLPCNQIVQIKYNEVDIKKFPDDYHIIESGLREDIEFIKWRAISYEKRRQRIMTAKLDAERSELEYIFSVINPFILAFAFAIRFTKVSGELHPAPSKSPGNNPAR